MCGISAIYSWKNKKIPQLVKPMSDLIRHRGPDDEGYVLFSPTPLAFGGPDSPEELHYPSFKKSDLDAHLAFGHRRLSILELSTLGHQPMSDPKGRYWLIYNGEIYNYLELQEELKGLGHIFHSHSDSEVILHSYMEWGEECLHRFNGMFAFIIYDTVEKTLFGARDRFGIKPLYYWKSPEGFIAFASEIKQFTVLPGWSAKLNEQGAYDFLNWAMTNHQPETCFKGVFQLPGGHCFTNRLETEIKPKKWYTLPIRQFGGSWHEAGEQFSHLLEDSVKLRCRADVSVGSCLSGGLDSSSIVCLANQFLRNHNREHLQMTFSACSDYPQFDEREYIEEVVRETGVGSHYTFPKLDDLLSKLDEILWHQDEPFISTSIFAQWEVFNLVKKNQVKVMLDGQGADEQLAGYSGFLSMRIRDLMTERRFGDLWKELRHSSFKLLLNQILPSWIKQPIRRKLHKTTPKAPWLHLNIEERNPHDVEVPVTGAVQKLSYSQITQTNLPMLLHFEDRNSMAHSIEARTPFLDYRLVEFLQSLPSDYKLAEGVTKRVLRQGMEGILPEKVRLRTNKLGFETPEKVWIQQHQPEMFRKLVRECVEHTEGIISDEAIKLADKMIKGKLPYNFFPWRLIIFGRWMKLNKF